MNITYNNNNPNFGILQKPNKQTSKILQNLLLEATPETRELYYNTMEKISNEQKTNPIKVQEYVKTYSDNSKMFGIKMNGVAFDQHYHTSLNRKENSADSIIKNITRQNQLASMQADVIYTKCLEAQAYAKEQNQNISNRLENLYN